MADSLPIERNGSLDEGNAVRDGQHDQIGVDLISRDEMAASLNASVTGLNGLVAGFEICSNDDVNVAEGSKVRSPFTGSIESLRVGHHGLSPGLKKAAEKREHTPLTPSQGSNPPRSLPKWPWS